MQLFSTVCKWKYPGQISKKETISEEQSKASYGTWLMLFTQAFFLTGTRGQTLTPTLARHVKKKQKTMSLTFFVLCL